MNKPRSLFVLLAALMTSIPSFAIDQVTLKNGDVVEGRVLKDTPNRHVDIELVNGTKKRFERNEIANVERDVPSTRDREMVGNESRMYVGALLGLGVLSNSGFNNKTGLDYGVRFGVTGDPAGDFGRFGAGLSLDRLTFEDTGVDFTFTNILAQFLLHRILMSGFYAGPELGLGILSLSTANNSPSFFSYGLLLGYDYFVSPTFSIGPEVHYVHNSDASFTGTGGVPSISIPASNVLKVQLGGTFHF